MNRTSLKNCIATLERLRDATNSQLDTRVLSELDAVIAELKKQSESHQDVVALGILGAQALNVIGKIISLVSNITN